MIPDWLPISSLPELKSYSDFYLVTEGGFGEIYSAKRQDKGEPQAVIVKRLRPLYVSDAKHRELFTREARFYKLLNHPQIPRYFDGFISEQECFFIMERLSGTDPARLLQNARASGQTLSRELVFHVGIQACEVLDYLHHYQSASGEPDPILHCDIKPHNFLLGGEGKLWLIDYSVAQFMRRPTAHTGGTPSFMAPERLGAQALSVTMDLFPLVLTLYFLLTHETPLQKKTWTGLLGGYFQDAHLKAVERQIPSGPLRDFFLKNLQLKPEARAPNAKALQAEIQDLFPSLGLKFDLQSLREEIGRLSQIS